MANERPSQVYAQVVFDKAMASWLDPLKAVAAALAKSGLTQQLDDAGLAFPKKQELLRPLLPANATGEVQNFIFLLASKNEIHLLPEVIRAVESYAQRSASVVMTQVTSAVPLTDSEKRTMETQLRKQFGAEAAFEYAVDPAILGGIVVRAGDKVIDGSVAGKLAALKEKLK